MTPKSTSPLHNSSQSFSSTSLTVFSWMAHHNLKLNKFKTELLVFPPKLFPPYTVTISVDICLYCVHQAHTFVFNFTPSFSLSTNPATSSLTRLLRYNPTSDYYSKIPGPHSSNLFSCLLLPSPFWPAFAIVEPLHFYLDLCCHLSASLLKPHDTSLCSPPLPPSIFPYLVQTPCLDLHSLTPPYYSFLMPLPITSSSLKKDPAGSGQGRSSCFHHIK